MKLAIVLAITLSMLGNSLPTFADEMSVEKYQSARKAAAERQRRIIFNNDGNEPIYLCRDTTPEELLSHRTTPLAGTQVDSIFYCTWSSGFGMFTHDTKVGHVFQTKEDLFNKNIIDKMLADGTDPLQVMVDFGKKNNIEIFWSFRLNDTHDAGLSGYGPVMLRANPLKLEHPEWLISIPTKRPKFGGWSAVDFTQPEIRDLAVKYVEEVCQNYEIDGVEIDFFRHPVFFRRAAMTGTVCNDEERGLMTDMMHKIRAATEAAGRKRGKPILLAIRVPDSASYSYDSGLDIEAWMKAGIVDLLMCSGYYQLSPWEDSVALGKKYDVKVYPSLDESRVRDAAGKKARMTVEAYRGRTLAARQAGMEGVYLFNSFNPNHPIWRELGEPEKLVTQNHDYFASIRGVGGAAGGALPHQKYQHVATLNPGAPAVIKENTPAEVEFYTGADLTQVTGQKEPTILLRLQFDKADPSKVAVKFNDEALADPKVNQNWLEFALSPKQLKSGKNTVVVTTNDAATTVKWTDLHCTVRWPAAK